MSQEITVTKTEDHYEMQFGSGSAYPVPTNAIDNLDDDITPEEVGESVTFRGDYGGHKHCKTFDIEEVTDGLENADEDETESEISEETEETIAGEDDEQIEGVVEGVQPYDDEFGEASVGESGKCLHENCDDHANVAVKCDTGQIKHYCNDHHDGRRAGHALIVKEKRLTGPSSDDDSTDDDPEEVSNIAEPTPEHVSEVGYHTAAGQAQQIEAQRIFADNGEC